jgi:hypothetical protein
MPYEGAGPITATMNLEIAQGKGKAVVDAGMAAEPWFATFRHLDKHHEREPRFFIGVDKTLSTRSRSSAAKLPWQGK